MTVPDGYRLERGLLWPAGDVFCRSASFTVADLDEVYPHCRAFDTAVQAGGNCGIWPAALARRFRVVYTFEPDPVNFRCLAANAPAENVFKFNAALGNRRHSVELARRPDNVGAHQVDGAGDIPVMRIDDLDLRCCDLIYLDVEGYELPALVGAQSTIDRARPVIVFEEKGLGERYDIARGDAERYVADVFGYRVAARPHRDVVMVPA